MDNSNSTKVSIDETSTLLTDTLARYNALPQEREVIEKILTTTERRRRREMRVLFGALLFCFVFMIVELVFGLIAHSLALLTDASHLLIDVGSYMLSIMSLRAASRGACRKYSYGWHRAEVIGTLVSVFSIWALVAWITVEALTRMWNVIQCSRIPEAMGVKSGVLLLKSGDMLVKNREANESCVEINSPLMILIGVIGMLVNIICAGILYFGGSHGHSHLGGAHGHGNGHHNHSHDTHAEDEKEKEEHGHEHDHSHGDCGEVEKGTKGFAVHAALLHALGDCVQSVGVILAGIIIFFSNRWVFGVSSYRFSIYNLADPLCSLLFAAITLHMTKSLIGDLLGILMESTPPGIDYDALKESLLSINGVTNVHDLHVWSLSSDYMALSVHIVADDAEKTLQKAQYICETLFGISHTTIQVDTVENGSDRCQAVCA